MHKDEKISNSHSDFDRLLHPEAYAEGWAKARAEKGVSFEEIEKQTSIPVSKLELLEKWQFDRLGEPTFVAGYVRRYAKIIGLDPDTCVEEYKKNRAINGGQVEGALQAGERSKVGGRASFWGRLSLLHVSLVVVAVWVLVAVFTGGDDADVEDSTKVVDAAESNEVVADQSNIVTNEGLSNIGSTTSSDLQSVITDDSTVPEGVSQSGEQRNEDSLSDVTLSDVTLSNVSTSNVSTSSVAKDDAAKSDVTKNDVTLSNITTSNAAFNSQPESEVEVSESLALAATEPETASLEGSESEDLLLFSFNDSCWVEVKDAQGKVLFADSRAKGDNLQLFGQAPFSVMLGNAKAVDLLINGRQVSTLPPSGRKTLRLNVTP